MTAEDRPPPRVFISYAHDSEQHKQQVHELARFLRAEGGIDVRFDLWDAGVRRDWSVWMIEQFRNAEFVLVVASPTYKRRAEGGAKASDGRGVQFEAALLRDLLTQDRHTWVPKVLPVVLPGRSIEEIPAFLQPYSASRYVVDSLTMDGVDELYRVLTGQPRHRAPELGQLVIRSPLTGPAEQLWCKGQEVRLRSESYLIVELEREEFAPDHSWVARRAVAERLAPPAHLVVLRQVRMLHADESARRRRASLVAEGTLLSDLADMPGIPRLLNQMLDRDGITLALSRPDAPSLRDLYGPLRGSPDAALRWEPARTAGFLRTVYRLCQSLQALHRRGFSHREITPDTVLLVDSGRTPVLRDIGLATVDPVAGEGTPPYQAPEQRHPDHATTPGARTDVFQLAAIVHDTLTGTDDPHLPPQLARLLADARSPMIDNRPRDATAFGAGLLKAVNCLGT